MDAISAAQLRAYGNAAALREAAPSLNRPGSIDIPSAASAESLRFAKNFNSAEALNRVPTPTPPPASFPSPSEYSPYQAVGVPNTNPSSSYYGRDSIAQFRQTQAASSVAGGGGGGVALADAPPSVINPPVKGIPLSNVVPAAIGGFVQQNKVLVGGGIGAGVLAGGSRLLNGGNPLNAALAGLGATAGTIAGGSAGAALGSFIAPGVGTGAGGFIGASLGGKLGETLGDAIANGILNAFKPGSAQPDPHERRFRPGGVRSKVSATFTFTTDVGPIRFVEALGVSGVSRQKGQPDSWVVDVIALDGHSIHSQICFVSESATKPYLASVVPTHPYEGDPTEPIPEPIPREDFGALPIGGFMPSGRPTGAPSPQVQPTLPTLPVPGVAPSPRPVAPTPEPGSKPNQPEKDPRKDNNPLNNPAFNPGFLPIPVPVGSAPGASGRTGGSASTGDAPQPPGTGNPPKAPPGSPCQGCGAALASKLDALEGRMGALNTAFNAVDAGANALILTRLAEIDAKLGPQATGGISGLISKFREAFDRFAKWLHLDRILNVMTFVATLHNAYMLSSGLTQTLFSMFSNVLAAVGIKDAEGNPLNIQQIVGSTIENFAKAIIGAETVDGIKATWKKYSRIYQAAANILWSIQSIGYSILSALEVIGSWIAKIGNALQKWRVVGERAFSWMNPTPNFQNRFFTALQNAQDVVSQVDQVASEVLNIETTVANIGTQYQEIQKAVSEDPTAKPGTPTPEAAKVAAAAAASKAASQSPPIPIESQAKPEG